MVGRLNPCCAIKCKSKNGEREMSMIEKLIKTRKCFLAYMETARQRKMAPHATEPNKESSTTRRRKITVTTQNLRKMAVDRRMEPDERWIC